MSNVHMFIPTKGRAGNQKTIRALSSSFKKNHLTMVVPKSELSLHKEQPYYRELDWMTVPDDIHLTDKRFLITRRFVKQGGEKIIFADDDLLFRLYVPEKENLIAVMKYELQSEFSRLILRKASSVLDEHGCWALGHATLPNSQKMLKENTDHVINKKCCNLFAYNAQDLLDRTDKPEFKGIWGIDTTWNLETIKCGDSLYLDFEAMLSTDFKTDKGGASIMRTPAAVETSFLRMMLLHPGIISRGKQGDHIHSFLRIAWAKAVKMRGKGDNTLFQEGYNNFLSELKHQDKTVKSFLKELPSPEAKEWCENRIEFLRRKSEVKPSLF